MNAGMFDCNGQISPSFHVIIEGRVSIEKMHEAVQGGLDPLFP